jgi:hypothetical protein
MSVFDPLAPIEDAVRYGEQRAIREAEERENPALVCERTGHIATLGDGVCLRCGEVIW